MEVIYECQALPPSGRVGAYYKYRFCPDWCGSVSWTYSHKVKDHWFYPQLGHMPGLWVQSLVMVHERGSRSMLPPHIKVSLSLFLPPLTSLQK